MTMTSIKTKAIERTTTTVQLDRELSKVGISAMVLVSALISTWAMACMIGGLMSSGGPLSFMSSWYSAVIGG